MESRGPKKNTLDLRTLSVLALILIAAAAVRMTGLEQQGLLIWDEGNYLLEARYWMNGAADPAGLASGAAYGYGQAWAYLPMSGKPTHTVLLAAVLGLFGDSAFTAQMLSVCFGLLSVLLVFRFGQRLFGTAAGLAAAWVLALLPIHVMHSRMALPHVEASFFYFLGIFLWWSGRSSGKGLGYWAGFFTGLSATAHYGYWPLTAVPVFLDLVLGPGRDGCRRRWFLRMAVMTAGILTPVLAWQGVYELIRVYARLHQVPFVVPDYWLQLRSHFSARVAGHSGEAGVWKSLWFDPRFYPYCLWTWGGPIFFILTVLGAGLCVFRAAQRQSGFLVAAVLVFAPLVFFTLVYGKSMRQLVILLPAACLAAGTFLALLHERLGTLSRTASSATVLALAAVLAVNGLIILRPLLFASSNFERILRDAQGRVPERLISTQTPITAYYLGGPKREVRLHPGTERILWSDFQDGYREVLIDQAARIGAFD